MNSAYGKFDALSKEPNLLKGTLICGDCGKKMSLWRDRSGAKLNPPRVYYKYICQTYQHLKEKGCIRKRLDKKDVERAVEEALRMHIKLFLDSRQALERLNREQEADGGFQKEIREAEKRKKRAEGMSASLYNDYADGLLNEGEYLYAKEKYIRQAEEEAQKILELQETERRHRTGCRKESRVEALVQEYKDFVNLTEEVIHAFISEIFVYGGGRMEIRFRFEDEFKELLDVVEERGGGICRKDV